VALGEALAWGILLGAGVHTARMLATRAVGRHGSGLPIEGDVPDGQDTRATRATRNTRNTRDD
jgi:hypothetical protein